MMEDITTKDVNEVCIFIDDLLNRASPMSEHKIFKVPCELRQVNEKAYEPYFVSIGPYHRGKDNLIAMEEHKVRFLKSFLKRRNEHTSQRFVAAMRGMVKNARKCYAETSLMSDKEFLEMMVLDGCFIVELLHLLCSNETRDHIFTVDLVVSRILNDLILFENQLPFFVVRKLLSMTSENQESEFIKAFLGMFKHQLPGLKVDVVYDESNPIENVKHLLDLLHTNWRPPSDLVSKYENAKKDPNCPRVHSVTALREAGVRFKKAKGGNLFDIKYSNGVLKIPKVTVHNHTECLFRNIIVCEQFDNRLPAFLTYYMILMDRLIDSERDVEILTGRGIIINELGDVEAIATMFNRLGDSVSFSEENFFYAELSRAVNEHYESPWNKSIAKLRHDYFHNPWALISFLAAVFLLILSLLQTTFTIFPRG